MKTTNPLPSTMPLSATETALRLSTALGDSAVTWNVRLTNWRRPERKSPIPWHEGEGVRPFYMSEEVQAFIDATLAKRAMTTPPEPGSREARATATLDFDDGRAFVRVLWNARAAQGTFGLSIQDARLLAQKLTDATANAEAGRAKGTT